MVFRGCANLCRASKHPQVKVSCRFKSFLGVVVSLKACQQLMKKHEIFNVLDLSFTPIKELPSSTGYLSELHQSISPSSFSHRAWSCRLKSLVTWTDASKFIKLWWVNSAKWPKYLFLLEARELLLQNWETDSPESQRKRANKGIAVVGRKVKPVAAYNCIPSENLERQRNQDRHEKAYPWHPLQEIRWQRRSKSQSELS